MSEENGCPGRKEERANSFSSPKGGLYLASFLKRAINTKRWDG